MQAERFGCWNVSERRRPGIFSFNCIGCRTTWQLIYIKINHALIKFIFLRSYSINFTIKIILMFLYIFLFLEYG